MKLRQMRTIAGSMLLLGIGYLAGTLEWGVLGQLQAQVAPEEVSEETAAKIAAAHVALEEAARALGQEGRYEVASEVLNPFLILSGGGNALEDLESGQGVDPETFAALYAGLVAPEIQQHVGRDEEGRITYKNRVVRMYSVATLKDRYEQRRQLTTDTDF